MFGALLGSNKMKDMFGGAASKGIGVSKPQVQPDKFTMDLGMKPEMEMGPFKQPELPNKYQMMPRGLPSGSKSPMPSMEQNPMMGMAGHMGQMGMMGHNHMMGMPPGLVSNQQLPMGFWEHFRRNVAPGLAMSLFSR